MRTTGLVLMRLVCIMHSVYVMAAIFTTSTRLWRMSVTGNSENFTRKSKLLDKLLKKDFYFIFDF